MKFPFQKRVKLAQGLWLLSLCATVAGAVTFTLGCILKAELRRRAEVGHLLYLIHGIAVFVFLTFRRLTRETINFCRSANFITSIGQNITRIRICQVGISFWPDIGIVTKKKGKMSTKLNLNVTLKSCPSNVEISDPLWILTHYLMSHILIILITLIPQL